MLNHTHVLSLWSKKKKEKRRKNWSPSMPRHAPKQETHHRKQQKQVTPGTVRTTGVHKLSRWICPLPGGDSVNRDFARPHSSSPRHLPRLSRALRGSPTNRVTRPPPKNPVLCPGLFCLASPQRLEKAMEKVWRVGPNWARRFSVWWEERRGLSPNSPSQRCFFFTSHLTCLCCRPSPGFDSLETSPSPNPWGGETFPSSPWAS
ncbi:hypothetical protein GGI42DRAFT_45124 [Trichoderma sp. SZMC 28013]